MPPFFKRHWFLMALTGLIGAGLCAGSLGSPETTGGIAALFDEPVKSLTIAGVLLCMSVTLDGRRFGRALGSPGPVLTALLFSMFWMPLGAALLMPLQLSPDFAVGLMIAASVPCTLAAVSVWTRRAGGNDAVSLLVTIVTNGLCFVVAPFWLRVFAARGIELDMWDMIERLAVTALLPIAAGQGLRLVAGWGEWADRSKTVLGVAAQLGVLSIVFATSVDAGSRLGVGTGGRGSAAPGWGAVLVVTLSCMALHSAGLWLSMLASRRLGFERIDQIAVGFASSQKTLPIGVLIATHARMYGAEYPWAVFPMLIFHASQLFIDTAVADRFRSGAGAGTASGNSGS